MSTIYLPSAGPRDWQRFLADPDKQWKTGFSAKTLAHCWESAGDGMPEEITAMLQLHGRDVELLLAMPEHKVPLPGSSRGGGSQNDVFALARAGGRTFAIMIEGKVSEPFGETLGEWLRNASDGKRERLDFICKLLGLTLPLPDSTRYQLLHRTASAVIEARRFKTDAAAMIIHSFSRERKWFEDFTQFGSLFNVSIGPNTVNELIAVGSNAKPPLYAPPPLYIGWACGNCNFLTA